MDTRPVLAKLGLSIKATRWPRRFCMVHRSRRKVRRRDIIANKRRRRAYATRASVQRATQGDSRTFTHETGDLDLTNGPRTRRDSSCTGYDDGCIPSWRCNCTCNVAEAYLQFITTDKDFSIDPSPIPIPLHLTKVLTWIRLFFNTTLTFTLHKFFNLHSIIVQTILQRFRYHPHLLTSRPYKGVNLHSIIFQYHHYVHSSYRCQLAFDYFLMDPSMISIPPTPPHLPSLQRC